MSEHLLNIREAAEYLGVGERRIKELVDKGEIPAYRIGGAFLRFKKSQLAIMKSTVSNKSKTEMPPKETAVVHSNLDRFKDFFYFNDFYILSIIVIVVAITLMVAT